MRAFVCDKRIDDNRGFSLVELIICIAILAIATVPILSAFSTSGRIIGKGQSYQNATSIAEGMMEEIKGSTIEQIKSTYANSTAAISYSAFNASTDKVGYFTSLVSTTDPTLLQQADDKQFYLFYKPGESATNGEVFNAIASIDATSSYVAAADPVTAGEVNDLENASDANTIQLPVIDRIDKGKHAVIAKEINRLDVSALDTWVGNKKDSLLRANKNDAVDISSVSLTKEVTFNISENSSKDVDVECIVRYYNPSDCTDPSLEIKEKVYSGTFLASTDTRIYIFYRTACQAIHTNNKVRTLTNPETKINKEVIYINDYSAVTRDKERQVYFVLQEDETYPTGDTSYYKLNSGNTTMEIYARTVESDLATVKNHKDITSNTPFGFYGIVEVPRVTGSEGMRLITNLNKDGKGNFYDNAANDYIYQVEVYVYDTSGNEKAHLTSTKDAK